MGSLRVEPELEQMARFAAKVEFSDTGCWLWQGAAGPNGYGGVRVNGRQLSAHRRSYELLVGPIPDGLELDHLCRTRTCVNPDHLEPVTHQENVLRGDAPSAHNARKTHCKKGHAFDEANTRWRTGAKAGRVCRACVRARSARYYRKWGRLRATALLVVVISGLLVAPDAGAHPQRSAKRVCHRHSVQRLIRCYARRIKPPGGAEKALAVAKCESGFTDAPNGGLYQFQPASKFSGLADRYMQGIPGSRSIHSLRANAIVAMKWARDLGSWSPTWTCG